MSTEELLNRSDNELEKLAVSTDEKRLEEIFQRIWDEINSARHHGGQPKNPQSAQSLAYARAAFQLATHSKKEKLLLEAWQMMSYSLMVNEQYDEAVPFYRQIVQRLEQLGDLRESSRARLGLMSALAQTGRQQEALDVGIIAKKWFEENNDQSSLAKICANLGTIYRRLDDHAEAYRHYTLAADIFSKLNDHAALAQLYVNAGNALSQLDRFQEADEMYERSEKLSEELGMNQLYVQASYNRAYLHYLRGRYSQALQSFGKLRQRFEVSGSQRHYALCDMDEAEIYNQLNLSKDAAALAMRAADQFQALGFKYEQAKATALFGVAMMQLHHFAEALDLFRDAQKIFEEQGNSYWIGLLDLYRAEVHFSLQRLWEAQALASQAKATFEQLEIPSKRIFSLVLLGRVALALNDLAAAQVSTNEIDALIKVTKMPLVLFPHHLLCAQIAERMRIWDEAEWHYRQAAEELELHQARLHHDDLRVTFFSGRNQAYDALVRLSLDRNKPAEGLEAAYAWCEQARSRGLIELLSHYAPSSRGLVEQTLLAKIDRLREELNIHYARAHPETRPLSSQADFETITLKEQELARSLREISNVDPEYASLHQVSIATIDSVRAALPERTTLVEYFITGEEVLAFIVSRKEARVVRRLCPPSRVLSQQERLGFQLEKFMLGRQYVTSHAPQILESTQRHLQELYRNLMGPFVNEIKTPHIALIPHGTLHFLPFHAFFDGEKYLIDEYEISYAPSASVLKYCLEKQNIRESSPLLVGVADEMAPLVGEEISRLSQIFPDARVLRDEAATREAFVENGKISSFLHIATHAIFRQDNPMFSSFKLADGWFTAFDLFSMSCQTNLVTLSGCQSGMSEVTGSDDLLGLMRGFLYAGARSLLLSLWNVNDESTAELMARFYREWQKGATKSTALRSAMLAVRQEHPNPFYWAPFLLVGNP
jgi:CHAT domain-containing protein